MRKSNNSSNKLKTHVLGGGWGLVLRAFTLRGRSNENFFDWLPAISSLLKLQIQLSKVIKVFTLALYFIYKNVIEK